MVVDAARLSQKACLARSVHRQQPGAGILLSNLMVQIGALQRCAWRSIHARNASRLVLID